MIEIKDKYFIMITNGNEDIVKEPKNLLKLTISFEAGFNIPIFELVFLTGDNEVIKSINERSEFYCQIGKDSNSPYILTLYPRNVTFQKSGEYFKVIMAGTIIVPQKYYNNSIVFSKKGFSKEIFKDVLNKIDITTNDYAVETNDFQTWLNYNETPFSFLKKIYKHSYINDNNILFVGFNFSGEFLIKDLETQTSSDEKINFINVGKKSDKDKIYNLDYDVYNDFGILNSFGVYEKNILNYNIIKNSDEIIKTPKLDTVFSNSSFINVINLKISKNIGSVFYNENMHDNYFKAPLVLKGWLSLLSELQLEIETDGEFLDVELFDKVYFNDYATLKNSDQHLEGYYIISKIDIIFFKGVFSMKFNINRESQNNLKELGVI